MKIIIALICVWATLFLAGCDVKDPIYNTPHPDHGTVPLTTDWSDIGTGLPTPESYTVIATRDGSATAGYTATLTGVTNRLDHLFEPGAYRFCVYNTAEHITVSGTVATVAGASGNVDGAGQFVQEMPGWLFTDVVDATIEKDTKYAVTAVMKQQVRQLTLIIEPTGGSTNRIEHIEGYLSGAASTLDFDNGTHSAPANVELQFTKITEGADAGKYAATVRLLGVAGARQKLNALICYTDDTPKATDLTSDLTTKLAAFNADKRTPLTLGGKVVETPTEAGFGATITDWIPVSGSGTAD